MEKMFNRLFVFICLICSSIAQSCDRSSTITQCSKDQICGLDGYCQNAVPCDSAANCVYSEISSCRTDYCQDDFCTATGQCVHGQVCTAETNVNRTCVNPIYIEVDEGDSFTLEMQTTVDAPQYFTETRWDIRKRGTHLAFSVASLNGGTPRYWGNLCDKSEGEHCDTSNRGDLNTTNGTLTISPAELRDEGVYYYGGTVYGRGNVDGDKYESQVTVNVPPKASEMTIDGLPDLVEPGQIYRLTCRIGRIKPLGTTRWYSPESSIYPTSQSSSTVLNDDGKTYTQQGVINVSFSTDNHGHYYHCEMKAPNGKTADIRKQINIASAPDGSPTIEPSKSVQVEGTMVKITCKTDNINPGNPPCPKYHWTKDEGQVTTVITEEPSREFKLDLSSAGNYTCHCFNDYGYSGESGRAEVVIVEGSLLPANTETNNVGLIVGVVVGVLLLLILIVLVVLLTRRGIISLPQKSGKSANPDRPRPRGGVAAGDPSESEYETIRQSAVRPYDKLGNPGNPSGASEGISRDILRNSHDSQGYLTPENNHDSAGYLNPLSNQDSAGYLRPVNNTIQHEGGDHEYDYVQETVNDIGGSRGFVNEGVVSNDEGAAAEKGKQSYLELI